jgi:hypothetical protein
LGAAVTEVETVAAIAVGTVVVIAAAVDVGDAVADAIVADARSRVARVGAICLPRSMRRHKAVSRADTRIAADRRAASTIGVPRLRAARRLP